MQEFLFYPLFILILFLFRQDFRCFRRNRPAAVVQNFHLISRMLEQRIPYFSKLSRAGKEKFIDRLNAFNNSKEYVGMEGLAVTSEMRVIIAAPAIQLTFGLENHSLETISRIEVYAETFYSRFHSSMLKGITTGSGVLAVSWNDIQHGYSVSDDRYNLGLHEMAHALKLTITRERGVDMNFASYFENWLALGIKEYFRMKHEGGTFMREYGGTNTEEFFAVAVEHFFEVPAEFRANLPDIYNHLCILLNQDPLNSGNDYSLRPGFVKEINLDKTLFPVPEKIVPNYRYSKWHWTLTLLLTGFITIFAFPLVAATTRFNQADFLRLSLGMFASGAIVFFKPVIRKGVMTLWQFALYLLIIVLPLGLFLFFSINRVVITGEERTEHFYISPATMLKMQNSHRDSLRQLIREGKLSILYSRDSVVVKSTLTGVFGYEVDGGSTVEWRKRD